MWWNKASVSSNLCVLALLLSVSGFFAASCSDETPCTTESFVSIYVELVDAQGDELASDADEAVVEYRDHSTGDWQPCSGESLPSYWECAGWDNPGVYDVRATVGELSGMVADIRVPQDRQGGCHITSQSVDVVMQ